MRKSVVYFLRSTENPLLYKIGYTSSSATSRMHDIQTSCPFKLELSHFLPGDTKNERELHRLLRDERRSGEWFEGENTHCLAWATLETGSVDPKVFIPWLRDELADIHDSLATYSEDICGGELL